MNLNELNDLTAAQADELLFSCCGCSSWVEKMLRCRPYDSSEDLFNAADDCWQNCSESDFLEAFSHHPKIGDLDSLRKKFASTAHLAASEQASVSSATEEVLQGLADGNKDYEAKFGFIFIVCASGKSASEMLEILRTRLPNSRETELRIAAGEQAKITKIRLEKLLS